MPLTPESFDAVAHEIAATNNLPIETALGYAAYIGDTPELADDGRVVVRDESGAELARIILPTE
jgi:hypothetical protein